MPTLPSRSRGWLNLWLPTKEPVAVGFQPRPDLRWNDVVSPWLRVLTAEGVAANVTSAASSGYLFAHFPAPAAKSYAPNRLTRAANHTRHVGQLRSTVRRPRQTLPLG